MRSTTSLPLALIATLLPGLALCQNMTTREILTAAEIALPSSRAPAPFSPESTSADFAAEIEDRNWAPSMEARIIEEIDKARAAGLIVRRTDVECRSSTCAVLLVHATGNGSGASVRQLTQSLRENLLFAALRTADKQIPLQYTVASGPNQGRTGTQFISGYTEIVLVGGIDTNLQASENARAP